MNLTLGELEFLIACVDDIYAELDDHTNADAVYTKLVAARNTLWLDRAKRDREREREVRTAFEATVKAEKGE